MNLPSAPFYLGSELSTESFYHKHASQSRRNSRNCLNAPFSKLRDVENSKIKTHHDKKLMHFGGSVVKKQVKSKKIIVFLISFMFALNNLCSNKSCQSDIIESPLEVFTRCFKTLSSILFFLFTAELKRRVLFLCYRLLQ